MTVGHTINAWAFSVKNFQDRALGKAILEAIDRADPRLLPVKCDRVEPLKGQYKPGNHEGPLSHWMGETNTSTKIRGDLLMSGKAPSNVEYLFSWDREPLLFNLASIDVSPEYCEKPEGRQALVHLFDELVRLCDPVFGAVCYYPPANDNMAQLVDLRIRLPQPGWILYLGRPYISLFGEERLLSAPCQEVQRLASGHIKLRLAETPFSVDVKVRQQLREYLGSDAFVEEGKSIRRYRTGFAPVFDFSAKTASEP